MTAVDEGAFAGDRARQYHLRESPANTYNACGADDAGGILQRLSTTTSWSFCVSSELSAYGSHKASLNDFVADERVFEGIEDLTGKTTAQIGLYTLGAGQVEGI
jgi:hypothetical protein